MSYAPWHLIKVNHRDGSKEYAGYRKRWDNPILGDFPIHLDIETSISCNLKCVMCFHGRNPIPQQFMDITLYEKILKEIEQYHLDSIKFQLRGEPLLDDRLPEFIAMAKERGVIETMINTNGTLLTPEKSYKLITSGLDKIIFSVEGHNKKIYEKIRVGAKFGTVLNNIKEFRHMRDMLKRGKPIITLTTVKMNDVDIGEYEKFWAGIADQIGYADLVPSQNPENNDILPDFACPDLWRRLFIMVDGTVLPCCSALDWHDGVGIQHRLGNLTNTDESIHWHWTQNAILGNLRFHHQTGKSHENKLCRMCRYNRYRGNK